MKIRFEYFGGSRDGQTDVGDTNEPYAGGRFNWADGHYRTTRGGAIGSRFRYLTQRTIDEIQASRVSGGGTVTAGAEDYEVTQRLKVGDEVLIRCKFVGHAPHRKRAAPFTLNGLDCKRTAELVLAPHPD